MMRERFFWGGQISPSPKRWLNCASKCITAASLRSGVSGRGCAPMASDARRVDVQIGAVRGRPNRFEGRCVRSQGSSMRETSRGGTPVCLPTTSDDTCPSRTAGLHIMIVASEAGRGRTPGRMPVCMPMASEVILAWLMFGLESILLIADGGRGRDGLHSGLV